MFGYPQLTIKHFDEAVKWLDKDEDAPPALKKTRLDQDNWGYKIGCSTSCCFFGAAGILAGIKLGSSPKNPGSDGSTFDHALYGLFQRTNWNADQVSEEYHWIRDNLLSQEQLDDQEYAQATA